MDRVEFTEAASPERLCKIQTALAAGQAVYCSAPLAEDAAAATVALSTIQNPVTLMVGYHHLWSSHIGWIHDNIELSNMESIVIHAFSEDVDAWSTIEQALAIPGWWSHGTLQFQKCVRPTGDTHLAQLAIQAGDSEIPVTIIAGVGPASFLVGLKCRDGRSYNYDGVASGVSESTSRAVFQAGQADADSRCGLSFGTYCLTLQHIWKNVETELLSRFQFR